MKRLLLIVLFLVACRAGVNAHVIGDTNSDGYVTSADVTTIYDYLLHTSSTFMSTMDVNGDGYVTSADVTAIYDILLGNFDPGSVREYKVNGVNFKMVEIEGGTFTMGATPEQGSDAESNESPAHQVTLSAFSIGETEVTQELWLAVTGSNPSYFNGYGNSNYGSDHSSTNYGTNLQRPVEFVSWNDCKWFISKLNQMTGMNFRLPTEAEWEFAARGGNKSLGCKYAGSNTVGDVAWYMENACSVGESSPDYGTHAVATKQPNELGLYDMSGNVWEWCQDWFSLYGSAAQTDPTGPATGSYRVYRGGSWDTYGRGCRVSFRQRYLVEDREYKRGLRLAL